MKRHLGLALIASFLLALHPLARQPVGSPLGAISPRTGLLVKDDVVVALIQNSSGDLARDTVARLSLWDRSQVTEGYAVAAEWIAGRAREIGLQQVGIERFVSDGKTEYFGNPTQRQWKVRKGDIWVTSPVEIRLTSFEELPMSLAGNSTTSEVEAELVDVGPGLAERDYDVDVKGKVVLASGRPGTVFRRAVEGHGAAGVISSWSVPEFDRANRLPGDHVEQVGWSGIAEGDGRPGRFAFLVSARRAEELRGLLSKGPVRVRASVDAELLPGSLDVVSGLIPGSRYPREEVVITAHLDHYKPGANDNASGSAAILEMASTMRRLIDAGRIPPPLRTIRFMWVPEYSGTWAWFSTHLNDGVTRIANLNFDMVGENAKTTNAVRAISYTPDSKPSYLNAVVESIARFVDTHNDDRYPQRPEFLIGSLNGTRNRSAIRMVPYMTGTDHELFNNAGVPGTTLGVFPDDFYHSSGDSIEQVDPTELHRAVVVGLLGMTTLAWADDQEAPAVAWLTLLYGRERSAAAEHSAVQSLISANGGDFAALDQRAGALITHVWRRERAAVASAAVFARAPETRTRVERVAALVDGDEAPARKRVEAVAVARASELSVTRKARALTEAEQRATRLVPRWVPGRQLVNVQSAFRSASPDQLRIVQEALGQAMTRMRAEGTSELRLMGLPNAPAVYADGVRSLLEIADAVGLEYAPLPVEALEAYFRAFEKAGAMTIGAK